MKRSVLVGCCGFLLAAGSAQARSSPEACKVRVGHERPRGCAPFRAKSVKPPRERERQAAAAPAAPDEPWVRSIREPSNQPARRQSQRLLIQELVNLERLLRQLPKKSPERLRVIRRLAEGYAELEALAALERARAEYKLERVTRKRAKQNQKVEPTPKPKPATSPGKKR